MTSEHATYICALRFDEIERFVWSKNHNLIVIIICLFPYMINTAYFENEQKIETLQTLVFRIDAVYMFTSYLRINWF